MVRITVELANLFSGVINLAVNRAPPIWPAVVGAPRIVYSRFGIESRH